MRELNEMELDQVAGGSFNLGSFNGNFSHNGNGNGSNDFNKNASADSSTSVYRAGIVYSEVGNGNGNTQNSTIVLF